MKISVIYHSESKNTQKVAELIANGARITDEVEVKCMPIEDVDSDFLNASKAVFFGSPVYCGSYSWQMKKWLDTNNNKIAGKLGAVFATENHIGGGADLAELSLIGSLLVYGMVIYSAGASQGDPYTHFGAVCIREGDEKQKERARIFGSRIAKKAVALFGN
jgi:NAD(P)H dehydrogenase (quinone)